MKERSDLGVVFRPYERSDRGGVLRLLSDLPNLYPEADRWLDNRLGEVLLSKARSTVAVSGTNPIGITIETPKGAGRIKLSTIGVHPVFRGFGIGAGLIERCVRSWGVEKTSHAYVTVRADRSFPLRSILNAAGFHFEFLQPDRYGHGCHEMIFSWRPSDQIVVSGASLYSYGILRDYQRVV
jgi:hypothetical protein